MTEPLEHWRRWIGRSHEDSDVIDVLRARAMQATINSFLQEMVDDEMLISYTLEVTATRDEEIKGIARVNILLRPTFSIDFIKVTMFLQ